MRLLPLWRCCNYWPCCCRFAVCDLHPALDLEQLPVRSNLMFEFNYKVLKKSIKMMVDGGWGGPNNINIIVPYLSWTLTLWSRSSFTHSTMHSNVAVLYNKRWWRAFYCHCRHKIWFITRSSKNKEASYFSAKCSQQCWTHWFFSFS